VKLALLAIPLTLLSEVLQNAYVTIFYDMPFLAAMITGLPSLVTSLINNIILLGALGPRLIRILLPKASIKYARRNRFLPQLTPKGISHGTIRITKRSRYLFLTTFFQPFDCRQVGGTKMSLWCRTLCEERRGSRLAEEHKS
jgi:hypothetical protein